MSADAAQEHPEELIESGPAGGVAAGSYLSELLGRAQPVSTDMGGTSFDVCLIEDGRGLVRDDYEIEWDMPIDHADARHPQHRRRRRLDRLDRRRRLAARRPAERRRRPRARLLRARRHRADGDRREPRCSAGSTRRSAASSSSTSTAAEAAIATVAEPLGLDAARRARRGSSQIVSENMAIGDQDGLDRPRPRSARPRAGRFGGAGGMHAYAIARSVGIDEVLVPPFAGVACAFGATTMDVRHDLETTFYAPAAERDPADADCALRRARGRGPRAARGRRRRARRDVELERSAHDALRRPVLRGRRRPCRPARSTQRRRARSRARSTPSTSASTASPPTTSRSRS